MVWHPTLLYKLTNQEHTSIEIRKGLSYFLFLQPPRNTSMPLNTWCEFELERKDFKAEMLSVTPIKNYIINIDQKMNDTIVKFRIKH